MLKTFLSLSASSLKHTNLNSIKPNPFEYYKILHLFSTKKGKPANPYGLKASPKGQQASKLTKQTRITPEPGSPYNPKTIISGTKDSKTQNMKNITSPTVAKQENPLLKSGKLAPVTVINKEEEIIDEELEKFKKSGKVTILATEESDEGANFKLDLPWDFKGIITKQPEKNLKAPLGVGKIMSFPIAIGIFKDYVQALEDYDTERLQELLEDSFFDRVSKNLDKMQKKGYKFKLEGISSKKNKVDLFNISNFFCVGASSNRKLNDGANHYMIFDNFIEGSPTKNYIKHKQVGNEKAVVKVILDLMFETPVKLQLFDPEGNPVGKKGEKEIEFHHMRIENDIYEVDYKHLKRSVEGGGEVEGEDLSSFQVTFSHDNWKVIDFDNYMKGNDIISSRVIL